MQYLGLAAEEICNTDKEGKHLSTSTLSLKNWLFKVMEQRALKNANNC
jgi:hypothetical protein